MSEKFANQRAATTLSGALDQGVTTATVTSADGLPDTGTFRIIVGQGALAEIVTVSDISGTTLTGLIRGAEGTTDRDWPNHSAVSHILTAGSFQQGMDDRVSDHSADTTSVHGITDTTLLETQAGAQMRADAAQVAAESYTDTEDAAHSSDTTDIHGITDTAVLETATGAQAKVDIHTVDTTSVHGINDTSVLETTTGAAAKVATHEADTSSVHGINDTSTLETQTGSAAKVTAHTTATDPHADRAYADALSQGLQVKAAVRATTTANITLSGAQTIDGASVIASDRVLVKAQTLGQNNGLYVAASGAWTRSTDADTSAEVTPGLFAFVNEGTVNANTGWVLSTPAPITLGTTVLTFAQFSGAGQITAGAGLTKTGSTLDLISSDASLTVTADDAVVAATHSGSTHAATQAAAEATAVAADASHVAAGDPHTGYQKESEKGAGSGYASLDGSTKVPIAQVPTGTSSSTVALGDAAAALDAVHLAADTGTSGLLHINVSEAIPMKFISTTGNDSTGDGRFDRPYLTVQKGYDALPDNRGVIHVNPGTYVGALTLGGHATGDGTARGLTIEGHGPDLTILKATSGDLLTFSTPVTTSYFHNGVFRDLKLWATSTAGHVVKQNKLVERVTFHGVRFTQDATGQSIWYHNDAGGLVDVHFLDMCEFEHSNSATVPGFYLHTTLADINTNSWENFRWTGSGTYAFYMNCTHTNLNRQNVWRGASIEATTGGVIQILGGLGNTIEAVDLWDTSQTILGNTFFIGKGTGASTPRSRQNRIINCHRHGGTLNTGVFDIALESGWASQTTIDNCDNSTGSGFKIDCGNNPGLILKSITINVSLSNNAGTNPPMRLGDDRNLLQAEKMLPKLKSGAGTTTIADGDFSTAAPPNGTIATVYDSTADRVWLAIRANGTWRYVEAN